ncbi:uncharacterized protein C8R40DRAFT_1071097 [Lentinula edodes]|uniref:uncharacterized protein n=1 Tax=Lentinula edodes TaxID=5353 RepID=UPI001E8CACE8|nr:uncharacterized protein C8R40DRAFT_1071097 [Lentinula edodes]KAH7873115.1 hypothetical protein C8R40DRAFT_1071097 [Lentinula edodes]
MEQVPPTVQSHGMTISNVTESTSSTAESAQTPERGTTESELFRSIGNRYFDRLNYANDRDNRTEDIIQNGMLYNEIEIAHFPTRNLSRASTETIEMTSLSTGKNLKAQNQHIQNSTLTNLFQTILTTHPVTQNIRHYQIYMKWTLCALSVKKYNRWLYDKICALSGDKDWQNDGVNLTEWLERKKEWRAKLI